jgi:hypothetical protein
MVVTGRGTQRFAVIEHRHPRHMQEHLTGVCFLEDDDGDGAAFDTGTKGHAATTAESGGREGEHWRLAHDQ